MRIITMLMFGLMMLASVGIPGSALAEERPRRARNYDPSTVETVNGLVVRVDGVPSPSGKGSGVHLTLKTDTETIAVHLGPAWYVDEQKVRVKAGDHIEVEGSRVAFDAKPAIIARQLKKDGQLLTLRNAAGIPAWAAHGGGRGRN
jgi:hypothetical protein